MFAILDNSNIELEFFDEQMKPYRLSEPKKMEIYQLSSPLLEDENVLKGVRRKKDKLPLYHIYLKMKEEDFGKNIPPLIGELVEQKVRAVITPAYIPEMGLLDKKNQLKEFQDNFIKYCFRLYQNISYHAYVKDLTSGSLLQSEMEKIGIVSFKVGTLKRKRFFEVVCADAGNGIPNTLRSGYLDLKDKSDFTYIVHALREKTSRFKSCTNLPAELRESMGMGLYENSEIVKRTGGSLSIRSGNNKVVMNESSSYEPVLLDGPEKTEPYVQTDYWFPGTLVNLRIPIINAIKNNLQLDLGVIYE
ncbi:hypothetical protein MUP95_04050 [bacterium]|nr:hypothetical protein [bacterium]